MAAIRTDAAPLERSGRVARRNRARFGIGSSILSIAWEISDVLGNALAAKLFAAFGGRRVYMPTTVADEHELALCLGPDGARQLADYYGGLQLSVPKANGRRQLAIELLEEVTAGHLTMNDVAASTGYTVAHLYALRKRS